MTKETAKDAAAKRTRSSDGGTPIVELTADGSAAPPPGDAGEACAPDAYPLPAVATLLDFVAWVVLSGLPAHSARLGCWVKGRGGYLADELGQVHKASIRVQVRLLLQYSVRIEQLSWDYMS